MARVSAVRLTARLFSTARIRRQLVPNAAIVEGDPKYAECRKFPEQTVRIETCGELYEQWRKEDRFAFRTCPTGNLTFDVPYVDTGVCSESAKDDETPVVLAMHGAPGSYEDFKILTSFLAQRGLRVIAPSFPDFSVYPPGVFRHSVQEKAQYIKDFLRAINVFGVDCLVCHSSAVYPGLRLCTENKPQIGSLALLNPGAYSADMRSTRFFPFMKLAAIVSEYSIGLEVLKSVGPSLLKLLQVPVRVENILDPLLSITTMVNADIPKARTHLHELSVRQFPVFLAFSEDDKMIQKELSYRIAYKLCSQDSDISYVTADGSITNEGRIVRNVKTIAFEKGSHYVFSKYPQVINEAIFSFLKRFVV